MVQCAVATSRSTSGVLQRCGIDASISECVRDCCLRELVGERLSLANGGGVGEGGPGRFDRGTVSMAEPRHLRKSGQLLRQSLQQRHWRWLQLRSGAGGRKYEFHL